MALFPAYSLMIVPRDESAVAADLKVLEATDKKALGRLLRVLRDIVDRGDDAREENVHLGRTRPALQMVRVGPFLACYAYGRDNGVYLLSVGRREAQQQVIYLAASRFVHVPPEV